MSGTPRSVWPIVGGIALIATLYSGLQLIHKPSPAVPNRPLPKASAEASTLPPETKSSKPPFPDFDSGPSSGDLGLKSSACPGYENDDGSSITARDCILMKKYGRGYLVYDPRGCAPDLATSCGMQSIGGQCSHAQGWVQTEDHSLSLVLATTVKNDLLFGLNAFTMQSAECAALRWRLAGR